jgi:hypothetical protein
MRDQPDRNDGGARVSRRFERARIEAQLFAEVCDILLSPQGHRGDTPRVDRSAARPVHGPVQVQVGR